VPTITRAGLTFTTSDAEKGTVRLKSWFTLLAGLLAVDAALALRGGDGPQLYRLNLANVVTFCVTAIMLRRLWTNRDARRIWLPLGVGMVSYALAFVVYAEFVAGRSPIPYPSVADGLWLAIYPGAYASIVLLVHRQVRRSDAGVWLDGIVAALAVTALGTAFVFQPVLDNATGGTVAVATNLAYPFSDITLLALVVGALVLCGARPPRLWLLLASGFAIFAVADSIYVTQATTGQYIPGRLLDVGWPLGLLLLTAAASQPLTTEATMTRGLRRLVLALPAAVLALALLVAGAGRIGTGAVVLSVATLAISLVRMAYAVALEERLETTRTQALTDELTGLGNRRLLLGHLEQTLGVATARTPSALVLFDLDGFKLYNDTFGHPAGDQLLTRLARQLELAVGEHGRAYRLGGDEFCALLTGDPRTLDERLPDLAAALSDGGSVSSSYGLALLPHEAQSSSSALALADRRMYEQKDAERRSTRLQMRDLLLTVVEEQRPDLHMHSAEVSRLCREVGARLSMTVKEIDLVGLAAELHDIGKVAIPDSIVGKAGPLDATEWELMKTHPLVGERLLSSVRPLRSLAPIVRSAHERWDGGGYPDGLAAELIPLASRVITACDAYDAMISDRPYAHALTSEAAIAELQRNAGTQFDPGVVEALVATLAMPGERAPRPHVERRPSFDPHLSTIASLRGLLEVTRLIRRAGSLESVLEAIARTVSDSLGLGTVVINLRRPGTDVFDVVTALGSEEVRAALLGTSNDWSEWVPLLDERFRRRGAFHIRAGEYDWTALGENRVVVGTSRGDDPWLWHPEDELFVPFYSSDQEVLGIFSLGEPRSGRRPTDDELDVLVAMAEHAATAVETMQTASGERPRLTPVQQAQLGRA
jgi:two-component system cell cycle response regulator